MLTGDARIRVLIADDHELVRLGLRAVLEEGGIEVVGEAPDGASAVDAALALLPDILLLDLRMPVLDGREVCRRVVAAAPAVRVVVLTSFADDDDVFGALSAGASSYVMKDIAPDALLGVLRGVAEGRHILDPAIAKRVLDRSQVTDAEILSPREREVLGLMAEGLANRQIAARLWISEATVKSHVSHILAKLGQSDRTQAIVHAMRRGLVPPPQGVSMP
ncbi:MAG: response regulator transcription factor [Coriobacteriia bacterium]|nr:response regulator transcription factor [Coriobacteriia bacterium]